MSRTTLNIDDQVLGELRERAEVEDKSIGDVASELLAVVLHRSADGESREFEWTQKSMGLRVDLEDKEALNRILDDR